MKIFEEKGYVYQQHLSTGGEGEIHLIKNVDRLFVAKVFPKLDDNSFKLLNNLNHLNIPNIPKIYELFNYNDNTIVIRDYIEGKTLYDELKDNGPFEYIKAKSVIMKICETLLSLHNTKPNPIIYRDLKPENIIITPTNEITLIDFGIARYHKKESTRDTILAGTKGYTAPEVLAGMQSDNRSDIYSVGLLFYEMLTGKTLLEPPYQVRPVKESSKDLENWLDIVIEKATDFNQTNRFSSISDFVYDLEHPHRLNRKKMIKSFALIASVLIIATVISFSYLWFSTPQIDGEYEVVLDLEFEEEIDKAYVFGVEELNSEFYFSDGKLFVEKEVCSIDFPIESGMITHFKVKGSDLASVIVGPYIVNTSSRMDCVYIDEENGVDLAAWGLNLKGPTIRGDKQFIDILVYTPLESNAVYVIIIDDNIDAIAHTAYRVPQQLNDLLFIDVSNFEYNNNGFMIVDSIKVIDGSLLDYLDDNFSTYTKHKDLIDDLLIRDINTLPDIPIKSEPTV